MLRIRVPAANARGCTAAWGLLYKPWSLVFPTCTARCLHQKNGRWILPENARITHNIQGSFTCRKSTWDKRLYFPSEGRRAEEFLSWKIRRLRPGLNPRLPKASTLPLDHRSRCKQRLVNLFTLKCTENVKLCTVSDCKSSRIHLQSVLHILLNINSSHTFRRLWAIIMENQLRKKSYVEHQCV